VISYGELLYGAAKSAQREAALERLRELTTLLPPLALPETAAEAYGSLRAQLEASSETIGNNDLWIAAHALASNLILVTNNERDFRCVQGLKVQTGLYRQHSRSKAVQSRPEIGCGYRKLRLI
jgi:tRNA(fMet)-specific endonuclease VapC